MPSEKQWIKHLFKRLLSQPRVSFPGDREPLTAPQLPGVYVIRRGRKVLHVGRTLRGTKGLFQRLRNHLHGNSSFTKEYRGGYADRLRKGHTYQCLVVRDSKNRALLECYAAGMLCPDYIGLGEGLPKKSAHRTRLTPRR
jgi:hypothetical protein